MTKEEKQLLLKDLSARLPYRANLIVARFIEQEGKVTSFYPRMEYSIRLLEFSYLNPEFIIKPYLRSMSSMTDEEENKYRAINCYEGLFPCNEDALDYVLSHHLDYRGIIPMGLALEAPEGMYKIK